MLLPSLHLTIFFAFLLNFWTMASGQDLYSSEDHCLLITSSQKFADLIYQKPKAFFVQFYSSKDPNSIEFASIWKKLAASVGQWDEIVQLAAVDCELESNAGLCKEQSLKTYPTLKYFKYETSSASDSQMHDGKKNSEKDLATAVARFVLADYEQQKPPTWPNLALPHDAKPGEVLWDAEVHFMALVFEDYTRAGADRTPPVVGVQVILDFVKDKNLLVRRAGGRHLMAKANDVKDFPGLLMFSRSHEGSPVYKSRDGLTRDEIATRISRYMDVTSKEHGHEKTPPRDDL